MDYSDSDSAPEEENVKVTASKTKKAQQAAAEAKNAEKNKIKQKRRDQHEFFTKQKELPAEILDSLDQNDSQNLNLDESNDEEYKKIAPIKPNKNTKKTFESIEKGPVTVRVVKKRSTVLAPKREAVISKRDSFLKRKSIRRK